MTDPTPEMIAWGELAEAWAARLGLADQRIVVDFAKDHEHNGTVSYHNHYPNAVMTLRDGPPPEGKKQWPFEDHEETIVHELVHLVMRDLCELVERRILPQLPKATRKLARGLWDHENERAVEVLSRALVAAKRGDAGPGKTLVRRMPKDVP